MKIKDLPQHLQELALKEAELQGRDDITFNTDLLFSFRWAKSAQGREFWDNINNGNFNTEEHGS